MNDTLQASSPRPTPRAARSSGLAILAVAWLIAGSALGDEPPKTPSVGSILSLADGGLVPGQLADDGPAGMVRWQADDFLEPFEFPDAEVLSIRFPAAEKSPRATGALGFDLSGGDILYGSLVELDDQAASVDVAKLGRVRVERSRIRRVFRWRDGSDLIQDGPNGLVGWREVVPAKPRVERAARVAAPQQQVAFAINGDLNGPAPIRVKPAPPGPAWVDDGRQLRANRDGATIQADLGLPARATIELELSWKQAPDFLVALGVSADEQSVARAFRLEVWDGQIVAVRETAKEAELATLQPVADGPGRTHLQIFLDQEIGRMVVYAENGELLADLKLGGGSGETLTEVRIANIRGDLRLERLRVGRWDGETPRPAGLDESIVRLVDRSMVRGKVERFDTSTREYVVRGDSGESRIAEDRVDSLTLPRVGEETPRAVRIAYLDGTQLSGEWAGVEAGQVVLKAPGFAGPLRLPQQGLRSMDLSSTPKKPRKNEDWVGELQINGLKILGYLIDTADRSGTGALRWQPLAGGKPSFIRPTASGRIWYRSPNLKAVANAQPAARAAAANRNVVVQRRLGAAVPDTATLAPERLMPPVRRSLYLRSGDIIPVEVAKIDEEGVWFKTPFSKNSFVPNDRVKAVELAPEDPSSIRLSKGKLERMLTLPRMQRDTPPKHLIRSTNGDILRGNVMAMDDKTIGVEVRLAEKVIQRDRISRIIWLHPDESNPAKKPADPPKTEPESKPQPKPTTGMRVQAVRSDGVRLTFQAEKFADGAILGQSEMLGECAVRVQDLDELLVGGSVEKEAAQVAYQNFKLQLATEPKAALAERGELPEGNGSAGTESPFVGKPAPDFQLELLGGKTFHLAENKGKVIVLDFWATWCGPCIQAMPQVDKVTREFADKGVQLIAVNLQEAPAKITSMLERMKLNPTVVLDRDGVVAAKYGANAIPQTVVIDRDGKVTRLFIGGGPKLGDQLREALQALMPAGGPS